MQIRVVFNQERNRQPEIHELATIPVPSSIYRLNIAGKQYRVTAIEEYANPDEVTAEIRVSAALG